MFRSHDSGSKDVNSHDSGSKDVNGNDSSASCNKSKFLDPFSVRKNNSSSFANPKHLPFCLIY